MQAIRAILPPLAIAVSAGALAAVSNGWWTPVAILATCDAFGRYRDFVAIKSRATPYRIYKGGQTEYMVKEPDFRYYGRSFCGRWVVCTIDRFARDDYYNHAGYRWYHILPDGFPHVLWNMKFWRNLAFGHKR